MRGTRRAAILVLLAGASGACEVLVGITDRQVAPHNDGGDDATAAGDEETADAQRLEQDTGPADVLQDELGAGAETATETSAPADAGADSDGGAPTNANDAADAYALDAFDPDPDLPCSGQGTFVFCDDFDTSSTPGQNWDYTYIQGDGGILQLDTVNYVSAPESAQVIVPVISGTVTEAQLGKTMPSSLPAGVRLALDFRLDLPSYTTLPQVAVAQLYIRTGTSAQTSINFYLGPGLNAAVQAYLPDAGAPMTLTVGTPAVRTWTRVALSYTTDGTLGFYQKGQLIGTMMVGAGAASLVRVITGAPFLNALGTGPVTMEIDNVVVKAQ
jgi:hypothetical protein